MPRAFPVPHFAANAHDLSNPFRSHTGFAKHISGARHALHRGVKVGDVGKEEDYISGRELASQHPGGPIPHHNGQAHRREQVYQRTHTRLIAHHFQECLVVTLASFLEALVLLVFLRQALHDSDGSKGFLGQ